MEDTFDIDWRDILEAEIHGIDQDNFNESMIDGLNKKLTKLCQDHQIEIK